jgi:hypothetical protein
VSDINKALAAAVMMRQDIAVFIVSYSDFGSVDLDNGRFAGVPVVPSRDERVRGSYAFRQDWDGLPIVEQVAT